MYLSVVKLSVHVDLAFCDITSEIRDGMSDVIIRHSQDRDLSDGTIPALYTTSTLKEEKEREFTNALPREDGVVIPHRLLPSQCTCSQENHAYQELLHVLLTPA